jgi:hypothetical protein
VLAAVVAIAAFSVVQLSGFVGKVGSVQASAGRLSSPVFPGEALGIWPEGDFRVVRGDVAGAYPAVAFALVAAAIAAWAAIRRRDWGLVAMGASAVLVYAWARPFASIYVEAKALAILSPLVVLAVLSALFTPARSRTEEAFKSNPGETAGGGGTGGAVADRRASAPGQVGEGPAGAGRRSLKSAPGGPIGAARVVFGAVVAVAFAVSTFLALRAAPVGFDQRGSDLESLAGLIQGRSVAFLGVDRFAGYWLRGTLMRSPGGYVPSEVRARTKKVWQQGLAMDFDTLSAGRLDGFEYAITTTAAYQSTPRRTSSR